MVLLLIRHGTVDSVGRSIAGRVPGVHLNAEGAAQAARLAECLARLPVVSLSSSPLERALETAGPIGRALGLPVRPAPGLVELDYGEWTGRSLAELASDPRWVSFNQHRERTRIPGGETMSEVVERASVAVEEIRLASGAGTTAAVTHGDVIRGLLARWLGMSLDHLFRLEVDPGSVSAVELAGGAHPRVRTVNWRPGRPV
ncbi:MAG TPA: histidine phosphatase family protein [Gemmatimonadales bacterium]|nr:histidine phosphatase family protein [Gemmatimonadales bacterium]